MKLAEDKKRVRPKFGLLPAVKGLSELLPAEQHKVGRGRARARLMRELMHQMHEGGVNRQDAWLLIASAQHGDDCSVLYLRELVHAISQGKVDRCFYYKRNERNERTGVIVTPLFNFAFDLAQMV